MTEFNFCTFGTWLKDQRRRLGMTQLGLARRVYCAEITIRKIEADQLRPSRELADLIVDAVQVAPMERPRTVAWARERSGARGMQAVA